MILLTRSGKHWTLVLALFALQSSTSAQQVTFDELSENAGIEHGFQASSSIGGGVAVFDFDNDGWQDIYLCGGEASDKLFRNDGDGTFTDVSASSGISAVSGIFTLGVVTGDIDNDGYRDILLTTFFGSENQLLRNNGNGTFSLLPGAALADGMNWTTAASFGDVNGDGLLDIYITSYVFNSGFVTDSSGVITGFDHDCDPNYLFINNGNLTFTEMAAQYGVNDEGCALATAFTDYDNDSDIDIMVVNDFGEWVIPNGLFRWDADGSTYLDVRDLTNMNAGIYGMGVAAGDYDRDGDLDYYMTNIGRNLLNRNDNAVFTDVTTDAAVENDSVNGFNTAGWGCAFLDVDNDAWPDLFISNGLIPSAQIIAVAVDQPNVLYMNNADGTFSDRSVEATINSDRRGRGLAVGDFNKDGKMDVIVNNLHDESADSTQVELYMNTTAVVGNWLKVQLTGVQSNRDAFGSHVSVWINGAETVMEVDGGSSYSSQSTSVLHFGLGSAEVADSVMARFPSGIVRKFENIAAGQTLQILEDVATQQTYPSAERPELHIWQDDSQNLHVQNGASFKGSVKLIIYDALGRQIVNEIPCSGCSEFSLSLTSCHADGLISWLLLDTEHSWSGKLVKSVR